MNECSYICRFAQLQTNARLSLVKPLKKVVGTVKQIKPSSPLLFLNRLMLFRWMLVILPLSLTAVQTVLSALTPKPKYIKEKKVKMDSL